MLTETETTRDRYLNAELHRLAAVCHLALGETDSALTWVTAAVQQHTSESGWPAVACDPTWDSLRRNPQFIELLRPSGIRFCPPGAH